VEEVNSIRLMNKWTFPAKGCFLMMKFGHLVRHGLFQTSGKVR
jgi:hypothetical protein